MSFVAGLAACQGKIGTGYLSAYPTELFEHLAQGNVWAPFYTYHKIMAGLARHVRAHGERPRHSPTAEGMGRLGAALQGNFSNDHRRQMLRIEYGGMNEILANLSAVTGQEQYLHAARLFEQPSFLDPLAERRDELQGLHANTHVPKVIGAARMYEVTGDRRYRDIAPTS